MRSKIAWLFGVVAVGLFGSAWASLSIVLAGEPPFQLPWPATEVHNINGGYSYGCGPTHTGADLDAIDFALASQSDVSATAAGTVIESAGMRAGYGIYVVIAHGNGFTSRYAHLDESLVSVGQAVKQGQLIAKSGNTGNSSGPHLHWVVYQNGLAYKPEPASWYSGFGAYGVCGSNPSPNYVSKAPASQDYNGNGCADIMVRESSSSYLWMYPGPCAATYPGSPLYYGSLWAGAYDQLFGAGGYTPDGCVDAGIRWHSDPISPLLILPGAASPSCSVQGFGSSTQIGSYWSSLSYILSPRDMGGDGCSDVVARWSDQLLLYHGPVDGGGNCAGTGLGAYTVLGSAGWNYYSFIVGAGDFTGDGCSDIFGINVIVGYGQPLIFHGNCNGTIGDGIPIGGGWNYFSRVFSVGDWDNDGCTDIVAQTTDGALWLYQGGCFHQSGYYWLTGSPVVIGTSGWNAFDSLF